VPSAAANKADSLSTASPQIPGYFKNILLPYKTSLPDRPTMKLMNSQDETMTVNGRATILVIGNDPTLHYLLGRFAEHSGYQLKVNREPISNPEVAALNPAAIIFLSTEQLARDQGLLAELASLDTPILVCSSVAEKARALELGADYCLLHPLTYDDFQTTLTNVIASKRV
jgi:hypothetical protein